MTLASKSTGLFVALIGVLGLFWLNGKKPSPSRQLLTNQPTAFSPNPIADTPNKPRNNPTHKTTTPRQFFSRSGSTDTNLVLLEKYLNDPALTNKADYSDTLGIVGDDRIADAFIATLTADFRGQILAESDVSALSRIIYNTGRLSARSEAAAAFLVKASYPEYWHQLRTWRHSREFVEKGMDSIVAQDCLMALGYGGRAEVMEIAWDYRRSNRTDLGTMNGAVATAVFKYEMVKKNGNDFFDQIDIHENLKLMRQWNENEGKDWYQWFRAIEDSNGR